MPEIAPMHKTTPANETEPTPETVPVHETAPAPMRNKVLLHHMCMGVCASNSCFYRVGGTHKHPGSSVRRLEVYIVSPWSIASLAPDKMLSSP
jgi:hypothetical protein